MSGRAELQAAIVGTMTSISGIAGVFDGPPPRAEFPYMVVDCSTERQWGTKSHEGREITVELTVWDDQPARLIDLGSAGEDRLPGLLSLPNWELSSIRMASKTRIADPEGPSAVRTTYVARIYRLAGQGAS